MTIHSTLSPSHDTLRLGPGLQVSFQRTLRIPDDGSEYPLPPGLGRFPLRSVADYRTRVPEAWRERGGVFLPMYQREAMWLSFDTTDGLPRAVKVGVGKVCAVTGKRWSSTLSGAPQDYLVTPPQPWLDGIATGRGTIRQFVAMPLGLGYTVEGQVSGAEVEGGIQLLAFEPRPGSVRQRRRDPHVLCCLAGPPASPVRSRAGTMGLSAGGRMRQKLYPDPHGLAAWDASRSARCFVHLASPELWRDITGEAPPPSPVTARSYSEAGLPWFDVYDEALAALEAGETLKQVKSVKEIDAEKATLPQQDDAPVSTGVVHGLPVALGTQHVEDGEW